MERFYNITKIAVLGMFLMVAVVSVLPTGADVEIEAGGHCDPTIYVCKNWPDGSSAPGTWHEPY